MGLLLRGVTHVTYPKAPKNRQPEKCYNLALRNGWFSARLTPNLLTQAGAMKVARLNTAYMPRVLHFFTWRKGLGAQHGQGVGAEISGEQFDGEELQGG